MERLRLLLGSSCDASRPNQSGALRWAPMRSCTVGQRLAKIPDFPNPPRPQPLGILSR